MLNLVRNLLLNLPASAQASASITEVIPGEFFTLKYPSGMEAFRRVIVGLGPFDEKSFRVLMALRTAYSTELSAYLRTLDNIFTFDPKTNRYFDSGYVWDPVTVDTQITALTALPQFRREVQARMPADEYQGLNYLSLYHVNPVWRVAAYVVMFLRAASMLA